MSDGKKARSNRPRKFFSQEEQHLIIAAIQSAELRTSGEIRCHIESKVPKRGAAAGDPTKRARALFTKLDMHETEDRNGVLFYLATRSHRFAVIGDEALHEKVGDGFWQNIVDRMSREFTENRFAEGLAAGIELIGEQLREHFPYQDDDVNELPDELSFDD